ncbi:unnamed protein product, partial [Porites lobata]
ARSTSFAVLAGLNIFFAITASLGNTLILIALHKVTSIYPPTKLLFRCLAVTDLLVGLISQPLYVTFLFRFFTAWNVNNTAIMDADNFFFSLLPAVSLLTSAAISVDRLLALLLGLRYRHDVTLRRVWLVIVCFWSISALQATVSIIYEHPILPEISWWLFYSLLTFSLLVSVFSYVKIFKTLRYRQVQVHRNTQQGQRPNGGGDQLNIARYKKTVYSIAWVQLALLICYFPYNLLGFLSIIFDRNIYSLGIVRDSPLFKFFFKPSTLLLEDQRCINIFLAITASLGNTLILIALHKVTSIYPPTKLLFRCLAVTDLLVGLISQPLYITIFFPRFTTWNENVAIVLADWFFFFLLPAVSLLTSAAISVDRLLALLLGLRYRHTVTLRRVWVVIVCIWLISALPATGDTFFEYPKLYDIAFWLFSALITFSLLVSVFSYVKIFKTLRYRQTVYSIAWVQLALLICYFPYNLIGFLKTSLGIIRDCHLLKFFFKPSSLLLEDQRFRINNKSIILGKTVYLDYKALYGNAMLVSLSGTPIWPPDTNRNICFRFLCNKCKDMANSTEYVNSTSATKVTSWNAYSTSIAILAGINIFLAITASLGNTLILIALHKVTSIYPPTKLLFRCLAVTDLLVGLISQPLHLTFLFCFLTAWNVNPTAIMRAENFFFPLLFAVSLLTSAAISVDRLLALLLGLRYRHTVTLRRVWLVIVCFWLISALEATVVSVLSYVKIFKTLRYRQVQVHRNTQQGQRPNGGGNQLSTARYKKTVYSIAWVQLALLICYFPCNLLGFLRLFDKVSYSTETSILWELFVTLLYLNSSLNPVLYCWRIRD